MVQKARRAMRYAGSSRIVPEKYGFEMRFVARKLIVRRLSMSEQSVRKWTLNAGIFDGFCDH